MMLQRISELKDRDLEIIQVEEERDIKRGNSMKSTDIFRNGKIRVMDILEREEREKGEESLLIEIIPENFPNL